MFDTPVLHLNYKIDKQLLLKEALQLRSEAKEYTDSRYPDLKMDYWLISHFCNDYIESIMRDFQIKGKPRFYWLKPNATVPEHVDNGTLCGLNFILTDNASPIRFGDTEYFYEAILVNTTIPHSVVNNEHERLLFKISIFDETFEEVAERNKKYIL